MGLPSCRLVDEGGGATGSKGAGCLVSRFKLVAGWSCRIAVVLVVAQLLGGGSCSQEGKLTEFNRKPKLLDSPDPKAQPVGEASPRVSFLRRSVFFLPLLFILPL